MLWLISVVLIALWVFGMVSNQTMHGYIHFLLIVAVIFVLVRIIRGRSPL
jgi:hypothetical protein